MNILRHGNRRGSRLGAIRLKLTLCLVAVGALGGGLHSLYVALTNRTPTVVSYHDCLKSMPTAQWLMVTNCELDVLHASWLAYKSDTTGERTTYYVPLREPNSPDGKTCILVKTIDPRVVEVIKAVRSARSVSDVAESEWVAKNFRLLRRREDVQGVVISGWDMDSENRRKLEKVQTNLAENYIIIDAGGKPSFLVGGLTAFAGLAFLGVVGINMFSTREDRPTAAAKPLPVVKAYAPPAQCPMCHSPVLAQPNEVPRTCGQCGADLTRR